MKKNLPLMCKQLTRRLRQNMQERRIWERKSTARPAVEAEEE